MIKAIFKLEELDYLIRISKTGPRKELVKKLKVSVRTLSRHLKFMRDQGAKIQFERSRNSYFYKDEGFFLVKAEFVLKND